MLKFELKVTVFIHIRRESRFAGAPPEGETKKVMLLKQVTIPLQFVPSQLKLPVGRLADGKVASRLFPIEHTRWDGVKEKLLALSSLSIDEPEYKQSFQGFGWEVVEKPSN